MKPNNTPTTKGRKFRGPLFSVAIAASALSVLVVLQSASLIPAYAHALPVRYSIPPGSTVNANSVPSALTITFSEKPDPSLSYIHVQTSTGQRVDNNDFKVTSSDGLQGTVTLDTTKLANDGIYTVNWRTVSADDGHIASNYYKFSVTG
jgi:methionine-rich copper-binding protein CopC